jgi:hypothetical protein
MKALQAALLGKLPVNIVSPTVLQNILRNVTLSLPENYALAVDSDSKGLGWYYSYVQTALISTTNGFLLVLAVPIRDVYRRYELFKLYNFPREVTNGTFLSYNVEKNYLAVQALHHNFVLLSDEELAKCPGREPQICAVTEAVYGPVIKSCVVSLYL